MEKEYQRIGMAEKLLISAPKDKRGEVIRKGLKNILDRSKFEAPTSFWNEITNLVKNGYSIEILSNHTSHADALPLAKVASDIANWVNPHLNEDDRVKGFIMPFAASMQTGTQGRLLDVLFNDLIPILDDYGVERVFTVTDNDIASERASEKNRATFARNMIKGAKEGKAIILFPEGKVEGGRRNGNGERKGMQKFAKDSVQQSLRVATSVKDNVAIIPVGISGGYNIYDPHKKHLPLDTFLVGLGLSSKSLFDVKVGMPLLFDKETIRNMKSERIDEIVGKEIANLLPENERGIYA